MNTGAKLSDCRNYRYKLWRIWNEEKPLLMFIGLNPSTANETQDDPTIKRVIKIAYNLGYGGIYMTNLFAIISSSPSVITNTSDPIKDNDIHLLEVASKCQDVIFCWGNFKEATERSKQIISMFPKAKALHINRNGSPKHPLYCKSDIKPIKYNDIHK